MNIALLYCGLPRWDKTVLKLQAAMLRRPASARLEVYVAFWRTEGFDPARVDADLLEVFGVLPAVHHVIDGYEPSIPSEARWPAETRPANVYKMYRAVQYVNAQRAAHAAAQGRPHDLVVRCRPDLLIDRPIDLARFAAIAQVCPVLPHNGHWRGGYCDQFALGSAADIDHYAALHDAIDGYVRAGVALHPERLLRHHLEARGRTPVFGDFEVSLQR